MSGIRTRNQFLNSLLLRHSGDGLNRQTDSRGKGGVAVWLNLEWPSGQSQNSLLELIEFFDAFLCTVGLCYSHSRRGVMNGLYCLLSSILAKGLLRYQSPSLYLPPSFNAVVPECCEFFSFPSYFDELNGSHNPLGRDTYKDSTLPNHLGHRFPQLGSCSGFY